MNIDNIYINYYQYGKKRGTDLVLLHGWGQNMQMMMPISNSFTNMFRITVVDLPGFGGSAEPKKALTIEDYADILNKLFIKLRIKDPILIGHSFGGRVSIVYAGKYKVKKLILLSSPFKNTNKGNDFKTKVLKFLKKIPIINKLEPWAKNRFGSSDYRNASPIMKEVLVNAVNNDLTDYAKKINVPTLLIWGECDTAVSTEEARELNGLIKDSGLIIYPGKSHYAYLEDLNKTISILDNFLSNERSDNNEN